MNIREELFMGPTKLSLKLSLSSRNSGQARREPNKHKKQPSMAVHVEKTISGISREKEGKNSREYGGQEEEQEKQPLSLMARNDKARKYMPISHQGVLG